MWLVSHFEIILVKCDWTLTEPQRKTAFKSGELRVRKWGVEFNFCNTATIWKKNYS